MRSFLSLLTLTLLVTDGGYSLPTPQPATLDPAIIAHAIQAAEHVTHNWHNNDYLAKRWDWGAVLGGVAKVAGGVLNTLWKRADVLPNLQLDKRTLSFLHSYHHPAKRTISFFKKYKGKNGVHTKRDESADGAVQIGAHSLDSADAQKLGVLLHVVKGGINNDAESKQQISDYASITSVEQDSSQTPEGQTYVTSLKEAEKSGDAAAAKSKEELNEDLYGKGGGFRLRRRTNQFTPGSPIVKAATDDQSQVKKTIGAAATQIVADQNKGQSVSITEQNNQIAKTESLIASTMSEQVNQAMTNSTQPIGSKAQEEYENDGNSSSTTESHSKSKAFRAKQ